MATQITINSESSHVNVDVEARSNIILDVSRSISVTGVQQLVAGNNITLSNTIGCVTIGTTNTLNVANDIFAVGNITANLFLGNIIGNIVGNIVVPGVEGDIIFNQGGNAGASSNLNFDTTSNTLIVTGNITANTITTGLVGSNLIPDANITYDLGNNTNRFNDLYLAGNSIYLGDQTITANANGISISGNMITGNTIHLIGTDDSGTPYFSNISFDLSNGAVGLGYGQLLGEYIDVKANTAVRTTAPYLSFESNRVPGTGPYDIAFGGNVVFNSAFDAPTYGNLYVKLGNVNRVQISGGAPGLILTTNGSNVLGWTTTAPLANSALIAVTVTASAQPNITSVGTLSNLTITGNITSGNASLGNLVTANLFSGNGSLLTAIAGANVSGTVANATYATTAGSTAQSNYANIANSVAGANVSGTVANATYAISAGSATTAGTVTTNAQPNITSVGTLSALSVSGNATITGNLTVSGDTIYANVTSFNVKDPIIEQGGTGNSSPLTTNDGKDRGSLLHYYTTLPIDAFMGWDNSNGEFAFGSNVSVTNEVVTFNALGNIRANYYIGNGSQLTGITATGGNANYANFAGNVVNAIQSNITSVGSLANLIVVGNASANSIQLNIGTGVTSANVGAMFWDATEQTVSLGMNNGVTQQIGLENYILVKADSAITNGQVVMFVGAAGENVLAAPANMSAAGFKPSYIIGIATQDIAHNAKGYITVFGVVHDVNTNAYNVGDILYVDPASTTGGLTSTEPTAPNYHITVGAVTKKSGTGHIQVRVTVHDKVKDLSDVTITTPSAGQALIYTSSNTWVNGNPNIANSATTAGTVTTNAQPNITSVGSLSGLTVSNATGVVNFTTTANVTLGAVANLHISGGTNGYVLSTDGSGTLSWVAQSGGGGTPGGTNTFVQFNDSSTFGGNAQFTYDKTTNLLTVGNISANGSQLTSIAGANVTGTVANATYATSAGSATTAATVTTNAQPNITSVGTLVNTTLGASNSFTGGNLVSATYLTGTLTTGAQPNITTVGTLTSLTVTNTSTLGNVAFTKYNETVVAGGNTGAATITPNAASGTIFNYTLTGNITLSALSNAVAGTSVTIILTQDATGNRLLTSTMKFAGASKTLSTAGSSIDIMSVFYDGTTYYATLSKGYA